MRFFAKSYFFLLLFACASVTPRSPFLFSDVEKFDYKNSTSSELIRLFGQPDQVVRVDQETDTWNYDEPTQSGERYPRMSFSVSPKGGKVTGGIWFIRPGDALFHREAVFDHFKSARFKSEVEGKIAPDAYSSDLIYSDPNAGILFFFGVTHQSVQYVSFFSPTETARSLSTRE